jgi:uncharacterized membrane protein
VNNATAIIAVSALLGSAIVGGVFFAFSSFIMSALGAVPKSAGIVTMQSINVVVINRSFLGSFFMTAILSLVLFAIAVTESAAPYSPYFVAGAVSYVFGTLGLTIFGNVPLNNQHAAVTAKEPSANELWDRYQLRWTMLNTIRTVAALVAVVLYAIGLTYA